LLIFLFEVLNAKCELNQQDNICLVVLKHETEAIIMLEDVKVLIKSLSIVVCRYLGLLAFGSEFFKGADV
jgi:hypothetical protein